MVQLPQQAGGNEIPLPRRKWIAMARLGMLVAVLALIAWYVAAHAEDFRKLGNVSWTSLAAALGLDALTYLYGAAAIVLTVHLFGTRLGTMEAMLLSLLTRLGNLLLPLRGGAVVRAVYLNRTHGLSYADFLAGLSAMLFSTLAGSLLCALGGLAWIAATTGETFPKVTLVLAGALVAVSLTVVLRPRIGSSQGDAVDAGLAEAGTNKARIKIILDRLRGHIQRLLDSYHLVSRHRPSLLGLLAVSGLQILTMAGIYALLLAAMGKPAGLGMLIVIVALANVSTVVPLTPGNVGVYEGILALLGHLVGLVAPDILAASLAWRALDTALILITGPISSYVLTGKAFYRSRA